MRVAESIDEFKADMKNLRGEEEMKEKDKELIREVSNSEFPLDAFMNDIECLREKQSGNEALEAYDFDYMEADLVKIAKTFKRFRDRGVSLVDFIGMSAMGTEFTVCDEGGDSVLWKGKDYEKFTKESPCKYYEVDD